MTGGLSSVARICQNSVAGFEPILGDAGQFWSDLDDVRPRLVEFDTKFADSGQKNGPILSRNRPASGWPKVVDFGPSCRCCCRCCPKACRICPKSTLVDLRRNWQQIGRLPPKLARVRPQLIGSGLITSSLGRDSPKLAEFVAKSSEVGSSSAGVGRTSAKCGPESAKLWRFWLMSIRIWKAFACIPNTGTLIDQHGTSPLTARCVPAQPLLRCAPPAAHELSGESLNGHGAESINNAGICGINTKSSWLRSTHCGAGPDHEEHALPRVRVNACAHVGASRP